ncbi:MAG: 1-acyl-sn-glycerol-3-phosphate acyltransferase [Alphaproteobacteria bacterium]|nr:1-acyl-sn-glycerol-3-phosphate acyltransferase [Alphaproteobacteria bacterium]
MTLIRSILFNLIFFATTAILCVVLLPTLLLPRRQLRRISRIWAGFVLGLLRLVCGLHWQVTGADKLPREGAMLIAAKHQSAFDTLVWLRLVPDAAYVLKRELTLIPLYGWYVRRAGHIVVDRKGGAGALKRLVADAVVMLGHGRQVVIFPEGTRTAPGDRRDYQPGIAAIHAGAGAPVFPVATDSGLFWGRRSFLKRPGTITVAVLDPIVPGLPRRDLMARLQHEIDTASEQLAQRSGPACG